MFRSSTAGLEVSVALCTFNGSAFIAEQIRSILGQSQPPTEIVVSDDASRDDTLGVIERVMSDWPAKSTASLPTLKVLRNPVSVGVTANFERALAACTSGLLALCDQDDVWHVRRLERMTAEFARRPALQLLHSDARLVDRHGHPLGQSLLETLGLNDLDKRVEHDGQAFNLLMRRNIVTGATVLLRRELLERSRPFPAPWVHDEWLAIVASITGQVDLLEQELLDYRQHGDNQIGVTKLDAAGRIGRLRAPRSGRNERLLARALALAERAPDLVPTPTPDSLASIAENLEHERARSALPAARARRLMPVVREWNTGRYSRFGRGAQDVLRDLVQPI